MRKLSLAGYLVSSCTLLLTVLSSFAICAENRPAEHLPDVDDDKGVATFQEVLRFYLRMHQASGATSAWTAPAMPHLQAKSPQQLFQWLEGRMDQIDQKWSQRMGKVAEDAGAVALLGDRTKQKLDACGHVAAALRQQDRAPHDGANLFGERFRLLNRVLPLAAQAGMTTGAGLELALLQQDYPDRKGELAFLTVRYARALKDTVLAFAKDYWELAEPDQFHNFVAFHKILEAEATEYFVKNTEAVYEGHTDDQAGDLAAIYLAEHYHYGPTGRVADAKKLVEKHGENWKKDPELRRIALDKVEDLFQPIVLREFAATDTQGRKWSLDDLKGEATMVCFLRPQDLRLFAPNRRIADGKLNVVAIPVGGRLTLRRPFSAMIDPEATDIDRLKKRFRLQERQLPFTALIKPDLSVLTRWEAISHYLENRTGPQRSE